MINFTEHPGRKVADIEMFALSTCPYCHKALEYLNEHDIEYDYIFVDEVPQDEITEVEQEISKYNPDLTFPTIVVDGGKQVIVGFDEPRIAALIEA